MNKAFRRMLGPALLAWVCIFPVIVFLPLFTTKVPFLARKDLSLASAIIELASLDVVLCLIVTVFGIVFPLVKMCASIFAWYCMARRAAGEFTGRLTLLGRLSMLDVFLLALVVVGFKGVGIGRIEIRYGTYAYAAAVILSLVLSLALERELIRDGADQNS